MLSQLKPNNRNSKNEWFNRLCQFNIWNRSELVTSCKLGVWFPIAKNTRLVLSYEFMSLFLIMLKQGKKKLSCQQGVMTDRAVLLTPVDIDNLFLIFIFIYPSLFYQSMTKSFPFVRIVFIEYLNILYCIELFQFHTFIDR